MSPLDALVEIEAIKRLKAEYFRCNDEQDWAALVGLFTADAETDMRCAVEPPDPLLIQHDPHAFMANNRRFLNGVKSAHVGTMPRIDILTDVTATGVWSLEDWLWIPDGHFAMPRGCLHGWGTYHDRYVKAGGRWLFAATRLTRIHIDFQPAEG